MSDNGDNPLTDLVRDAFDGIKSLFSQQKKDMIQVLRQPTPLTISTVLTSNNFGVIGGGLYTPDPVTLFTCPSSHEAWINRIAITQPVNSLTNGKPGTPLTQGEAMCYGSTAAELIFFLPIAGNIAPVLITEGRLSAAQLNGGEKVLFCADGLIPNVSLKIDLQIVLVTGISVDTPLPRTERSANVNIIG